MSLRPKGQCFGDCKADTSTMSGLWRAAYCNCSFDWDRFGLDDSPPPIPQESHCPACPEFCGNDWCAYKEKK